MLTTLRGATGGIVAKTFLVLLAGSFAVWGVADVFTGSSDTVLAKVGEREISAIQFRNFFDQRLRDASRRAGVNITTTDARKIGMDRQILGDLLRANALDEQARTMKMSLADKFVAKTIADNPAFRDASGNFDPAALRSRLYQANVSEQQFVASERNNMIRNTITGAITDGLEPPKTLVKLVAEQASEKRDVRYFTITGDDIKIAEPSAKQIEEFYNTNKIRFSVPERRVFETISIDAATLGKTADVTEEILKQTYEKQKARFGTPEKRTIEQIPFANNDEAAAALKKIREGASFDSIARERGLTEKDKLLGTFSKKDVPDPVIAEVAFKLKQGDVSEPVAGRLSTFLIRVAKISPAKTKSFADVRDQLVKMVQDEAGRDEILNLRDKVEDERGGGAPFKEIAKSLGMTYKITPAVDRQGLDENGKPVEGIPDWPQVLKAGNASDVGFEIDPIATPDDGLVWVNVVEVIQSHTMPFKDAKEKAVKLWKADQLRKAIAKKALALQKRANGGDKFEDLAKQANAEIKSELGIDRRTTSASFDASAVRAAFATPLDKVAISVNPDGKGAKIMSVSPVMMPPYNPSSAEVKGIKKQLKTLVDNDLYASYMAQLQKSVGVEIRPKAWSRVFQTQ